MLLFSLLCMLGSQQVHAQALLAPAENFVINRAEAAIVSRVAIARGFAANDPRIAATMTAMGDASAALNIASTAAATGLGFLGAPVWLTVAAGLGALVAGSALALHLATDSSGSGGQVATGTVSVSRSSDGKSVLVSQPEPRSLADSYPTTGIPAPAQPAPSAMQSPIDHGVMVQGAVIYSTSNCMSGDTCSAYPPMPSGQLNYVRNYQTEVVVLRTLSDVQAYDAYEQQYNSASGVVGQSGYDQGFYDAISTTVYWKTSADGTSVTLYEDRTIKQRDANGNPQLVTNSQPASWWLPGPGVKPLSGNDLSQIYPQLTDAAKKAQVDPMTLAQMVNMTWQRASMQPGYQGLPYSVSSPVTSADVQPWVQANPSSAPTLDDLFRPAADPNAQTVPISPTVTPSTSPSTDPTTNPGTNPSTDPTTDPTTSTNPCAVPHACVMDVDVRGDPGAPAPTLENTPTIDMILGPIFNLFPDLKAWTVPAHTGSCPTPSFDAFGHTYTMTTQCDLAEKYRTEITTVMTAVFALAALFIVLRA
ncbi:hypothetical protein [Caballeronia sp. AZ7_KS35]|uniref:hypothetical protein n=1 Tax=Caballeronia sp. AZ7_KS35 TaxID=2921762 RepID=UPI002027F27C|nr:hypothetical protein [Caballeronia sp. AZ7_KS35]